jgi:hypothetical protein
MARNLSVTTKEKRKPQEVLARLILSSKIPLPRTWMCAGWSSTGRLSAGAARRSLSGTATRSFVASLTSRRHASKVSRTAAKGRRDPESNQLIAFCQELGTTSRAGPVEKQQNYEP